MKYKLSALSHKLDNKGLPNRQAGLGSMTSITTSQPSILLRHQPQLPFPSKGVRDWTRGLEFSSAEY